VAGSFTIPHQRMVGSPVKEVDGTLSELEHLEFAIGEFIEMKMQPAAERALKRRENLKV